MTRRVQSPATLRTGYLLMCSKRLNMALCSVVPTIALASYMTAKKFRVVICQIVEWIPVSCSWPRDVNLMLDTFGAIFASSSKVRDVASTSFTGPRFWSRDRIQREQSRSLSQQRAHGIIESYLIVDLDTRVLKWVLKLYKSFFPRKGNGRSCPSPDHSDGLSCEAGTMDA